LAVVGIGLKRFVEGLRGGAVLEYKTQASLVLLFEDLAHLQNRLAASIPAAAIRKISASF
jgi:hypothetical protein